MKVSRAPRIAFAATALLAGMAFAQVKVGITVSATGPAASLGIPEKNTATLLPKEIAGKKAEYIVLGDTSNTTTAVKNAHKLIVRDEVDLVIGSAVTPDSLATVDMVVESETPMITLTASTRVIEPTDAKRAQVFKTSQNDSHMATAIAEHMASHGVKTVALIDFTDTYGDPWAQEFDEVAGLRKLKVVANERFARTDTSVTGQALKIMSANPDAVLITGSGAPAALPERVLKRRGYKGKLYQTHDVANADFLRVCGRDCEGTYLPAGPVLVTEQLPGSNPVKKPALAHKTVYEKAYSGQISTFGGHMWDVGLLLAQAVSEALKKGQPDTPAFRKGLRDAAETTTNLTISHDAMNMNAKDHLGLDQRSRVMVEIKDGKWKLQD